MTVWSHNGISCAGKMTSWYQIGVLMLLGSILQKDKAFPFNSVIIMAAVDFHFAQQYKKVWYMFHTGYA